MTLGGSAGAGTAADPAVLARGINMDHIFDPYRDPKEPWTADDQQRTASLLREEEFALVSRLGFTHVRLNLGRAFLQASATPFELRPAGFALLDRALDLLAAHHLAVLVDMHQVPVPDLEHSAVEREGFKALWRAIAARTRGRAQPIWFELLNEPRVEDPAVWRSVVLDLIAAIRAEDPGRGIVVGGGGWGGDEDLRKLGTIKLPNIVYSFHTYDPFVFTHQGATWTGATLKPLRGIRYPIQPAQMAEERAKAVAAGNDTWPFDSWKDGGGAAEVEKRLQPIFDWAKREGVPLYCGEFGVHRPYAPPEDRARWIADLRTILERHQVLWSMWSFHSGFDLVREGQADPAIVKALGLKEVR
jgi:aryl-phospho-beta-D-glucosidase BglC (GH1 family)